MAMKVRALLSLVAVLITMSLSGCGHYTCGATFGSSTCASSGNGGISQGTGGTGAAAVYGFIAGGGGGIEELSLDPTGGTLLDTTGFTSPITPSVPTGAAVVAQGQYLFVSYQSVGQIYGWTIGADGTLTTISGSPFSVPYMTANVLAGIMATNPAGTLLFVPDPSTDSLYVYQVGTGGTLMLASGSPVVLPFQPQNVATDGLGKYVYIGNYVGTISTNENAAYSIGSTGSLTAVAGSPFISPASSLEFSMYQLQGESSGKYMIGTTAGIFGSGDMHLYVFNIQQSGSNAGAITPVTGSPFATVYPPVAIAVQPSQGGDLVYSFSEDTLGDVAPVEGYQLNTSTGAPTAISGSPFSGTIATYGQFDQTGTYLFALNGSTGVMNVYNVGTSSTLTQPIASVGCNPGAWTITDVP